MRWQSLGKELLALMKSRHRTSGGGTAPRPLLWLAFAVAVTSESYASLAARQIHRPILSAALLVAALLSGSIAALLCVRTTAPDERAWRVLGLGAVVWSLFQPGPLGLLVYTIFAGCGALVYRSRNPRKRRSRARGRGTRSAVEGAGVHRGANSHWTSKGVAKKAFSSGLLAEKRAAELRSSDGHPMSAYRCADCRQWHVGRSHPEGWPHPCPICGRE